ncbi:MAG: hypothetical protein RRY78_05975, partial [Clostridia bacterium]
ATVASSYLSLPNVPKPIFPNFAISIISSYSFLSTTTKSNCIGTITLLITSYFRLLFNNLSTV